MARPERYDVDYFPHYVNHGRKMFYMRDKFGNDGYAVWFMILEHLGKAKYHYLDLKDKLQIKFLSVELKVSEEVLIEIIENLVELGEFDADLWTEKIIFSEKFIESVSDAYVRRNNKCMNKQGLCSTLTELGRVEKGFLSNRKPQRIGKDTKVDTPPEIPSDKIPSIEEFVAYALENKPNVDPAHVKLKYKAWVESGWVSGKSGKPIKNWKTTLLNTVPHLNEVKREPKPSYYKPLQ